jgi:hypothetical protein
MIAANSLIAYREPRRMENSISIRDREYCGCENSAGRQFESIPLQWDYIVSALAPMPFRQPEKISRGVKHFTAPACRWR